MRFSILIVLFFIVLSMNFIVSASVDIGEDNIPVDGVTILNPKNVLFSNASFNQTLGDGQWWALDGTNAPPSANWDMGGFDFLDIGTATATLFQGLFNWSSANGWNEFDGAVLTFNNTKIGDDYYNKSEVDDIASAIAFDFFFTNHTSDITGHYDLVETDEGHPESSLTTPSLSVGSHDIFNFTTKIGQPEFNVLRGGIYDARLHLFKTGTRDVFITPKLYNISSDGSVKNLLITFQTSIALTTIDAVYDLHGILSEEVVLNDGERLHMEFVAEVSGGGSNPTVTLDMEGTTDTHFSIETSSDAFEQIFLRQDGSKNMTGNLVGDPGINMSFSSGFFDKIGIGVTTSAAEFALVGSMTVFADVGESITFNGDLIQWSSATTEDIVFKYEYTDQDEFTLSNEGSNVMTLMGGNVTIGSSLGPSPLLLHGDFNGTKDGVFGGTLSSNKSNILFSSSQQYASATPRSTNFQIENTENFDSMGEFITGGGDASGEAWIYGVDYSSQSFIFAPYLSTASDYVGSVHRVDRRGSLYLNEIGYSGGGFINAYSKPVSGSGVTTIYTATADLSAGVGQVGDGLAYSFKIEDSAGGREDVGGFKYYWLDPTNNAEESETAQTIMKGGVLTDVLKVCGERANFTDLDIVTTGDLIIGNATIGSVGNQGCLSIRDTDNGGWSKLQMLDGGLVNSTGAC